MATSAPLPRLLGKTNFPAEAERQIARYGDAETALLATLLEFHAAVARSPQGPGHEMRMRIAELPPPAGGERALRFVRDNEWSDDDHEEYGAFCGNLYVARIRSENMYCEGVTWCWGLQDLLCQDLVDGGREDTFEQAKQAVLEQFLAWLKWAQL